ncbi:MAG: right-handed parallel beta-helix repeat-containing protein [Acetobacteraceae bacterium]|nr:right-handed parallel beta-helix repeat-containing protein [Acetobacteraceae bacterium]
MPTIDQLQPVVVASDDDLLPVSQSGTTRNVSRSQLLAGTQPALSLTPGLIGRASPGLGPPEAITIGSGLTLQQGTLSGSPRYSAASLVRSTSVSLTDLVPTWQNGEDRAISVRTLLSASGAEVSSQIARASVGSARRLGDWLSDAVPVEAFGAHGDGVTDDTTAFNAAIASGRPLLLGPRVYCINGQWDVQASSVLIGTAGQTTVRRISQAGGGAWINVTAPNFISVGVVFDAGSLPGDSWGVMIGKTCRETTIRDCRFVNATGTALGSGLIIQARDRGTDHRDSHAITSCVFQNNERHGVWVQAVSGVVISDCVASDNSAFGICLDFNDPLFAQAVSQSQVINCRCFRNSRGISIGNYNETNGEPPRWGLDHPDAIDIVVSGNCCAANSAYGIAVSGNRINVSDNQIIIDDASGSACGILCNASMTTIAENTVVGPGQFGIDAGGSSCLWLQSNLIVNCAIGVNAGGSNRVQIARNRLVSNKRAITIFQIETDGAGRNFGISCQDIWIEDNLISVDEGGGGIFLFDGPERISISGNRFLSSFESVLPNLCWAKTDAVNVRSNSWNGQTTIDVAGDTNAGVTRLVLSDVLDGAVVAASTTKVDAILTSHQLALAGQVSFVRVTNGGSGYSQARVLIAGAGQGASAAVYLRDGVVVGIALVAGGSGYDPSTTSAAIIGDGAGAALQPFVGLPVPRDRRVTLRCLGSVHLSQSIAAGNNWNWTRSDITAAAGSEVVLQGIDGAWQAMSFANIDYVQPGGDGSVSLRSSKGDLSLVPGKGGGVRVRSDAEQAGFLTCFGRGSPEGVLAAPPGSDFRNLDGGVGTTLWLKRTGNDSSGWFPIA